MSIIHLFVCLFVCSIVRFSLIRLCVRAVNCVSFGWVGSPSQNGPGHQTKPYRKTAVVTASLHSLLQMWRAQALHMLASVAQRRPSPEVGARHGDLP